MIHSESTHESTQIAGRADLEPLLQPRTNAPQMRIYFACVTKMRSATTATSSSRTGTYLGEIPRSARQWRLVQS